MTSSSCAAARWRSRAAKMSPTPPLFSLPEARTRFTVSGRREGASLTRRYSLPSSLITGILPGAKVGLEVSIPQRWLPASSGVGRWKRLFTYLFRASSAVRRLHSSCWTRGPAFWAPCIKGSSADYHPVQLPCSARLAWQVFPELEGSWGKRRAGAVLAQRIGSRLLIARWFVTAS